MKQILSLLGALLLVLSCSFGSLAADQTNSLTIDPVCFSVGIPNLDYELSLSERFTIHLGYQSFDFDEEFDGETVTLDGTIIILGARFYFSQAQGGGYLGVDLRSNDLTVSGTGDYADLFASDQVTTYALTLGYKKVGDSGFTWELGAAYLYNPDAENGTLPYLRIGYGF